jgi:hypothetical protein
LSLVKDLIDASAQRVVDWGGKIEPVHEDAARKLAAAGSIGAQLRF